MFAVLSRSVARAGARRLPWRKDSSPGDTCPWGPIAAGCYLALVRWSAHVLLLAFATVANAQPTPRSLLWRITHADDWDTSYLYGTIHSRDARAFRVQDSTLYFFDRCELIAGELDLEQSRKLESEVLNAMFLPDGRSLDRLYTRREYQEVITVLKMKLGPLAPMCMKMRPYYTLAMLSEMELGNDSALVLDAWLQDRAIKMSKRIAGLETVKEQLDAVARIPLREQSKLLLKVIRTDSAAMGMAAALDAYAAYDLDAIMALVGRDGLPEHADKALLRDRNALMADRADRLMRTRRCVFIAVGVAHLPGPHGLIEELRVRGYVVEPVGAVRTAAALPPRPDP